MGSPIAIPGPEREKFDARSEMEAPEPVAPAHR
jgi:hypothetical protein